MDEPPPGAGIHMRTEVVTAYAERLLAVYNGLNDAYDFELPLIQAHKLSIGAGEPLSGAFADGYDSEATGVLTVAGQLVPNIAETVEAARWSAERYLEANSIGERGMPN
jgi:hypothetical protein